VLFGASTCNLCPIGYIAEFSGSLSCQACSAGTTSILPGTSSCTSCGIGQFSTGGSACLPCEAGQAAANVGSASCSDCPGDSTSLPGSSACNLCNKFFYASLQGTCEACAEGMVCDTDGGATQVALPLAKDYWRISGSTEVVHKCHWPKACLGGNEFKDKGDGYCAVGYEGTLCATCIDDFFFDPDTGGCLSCEEKQGGDLALSPTLLIFAGLALLIVTMGILSFMASTHKVTAAQAKKEKAKLDKVRTGMMAATTAQGNLTVSESPDGCGGFVATLAVIKEVPLGTKTTIVTTSTSVAHVTTTTTVSTKGEIKTVTKTVVKSSSRIATVLANAKLAQVKFKIMCAFGQILSSLGT
jgi:hypothetical protein